MLKSFLQSLFLHIVLAILLIFAYLSPSTIKKSNKKPIAISLAVHNPTKEETTVKKETNEKTVPKEPLLEANPTPSEEKPQEVKTKEITPEKSSQVQAKPQTAPTEVATQATSIASIPNTLPLYAQAPVKPAMPSSPIQKAVLPKPETAPSTLEHTQVNMHTPAQAIAAVAPISSKQPLHAVAPARPSIASLPMQKAALPKPEVAPSTLEHSQVKTNAPAQAIAAVAPISSKQPLHAVAPARPSIASLPMQKPNQPQAETAPSMVTSTIPKTIVAVNNAPQNIAHSMPAPPAPPSTTSPAMQSTPNVPSAHAPTADETDGVKQEYLRSVAQQIKKYKTYPKEAKENNNIMGNVKVIFRIAADGTILKIGIVDSSGSEILDKAAVNLILGITKFQALPTILGKEYMDITLNIDYTLK